MKKTGKFLLFFIMLFGFLCVSYVQAFECCDNPEQQHGHDDNCYQWICKTCGAHWPDECEDVPMVTNATVTEYTTGTIDIAVVAENAYVIKAAVWTDADGEDDLAWYEIKNDTNLDLFEDSIRIDLTTKHTVDANQTYRVDIYFEKETYNCKRQIISEHTVYWKSDTTPPMSPTLLGDATRYYKYVALNSDLTGKYFYVTAEPGSDNLDGRAQAYLWVSTNGGSSWNYSNYQQVKMNWDSEKECYFYPVYVDSVEQTYTCLVRSIDRMGNWDVSESGNYEVQEVVIDNTAPIISKPEETKVIYTNEATATVTVCAEDNGGSGIDEVAWHIFDPNGVELEPANYSTSISGSNYSVQIPLTKEGIYTAEPYVTDKANNIFYLASQGIQIKVTHDTQAPAGRAIIEEYTTNGLLSISATASDAVSGIKEIKYLLTDENGENATWGIIAENTTAGVATLDLRSRGVGVYSVTVYAYDKVGNVKELSSNAKVNYLPVPAVTFEWNVFEGEEVFVEAWFQEENIVTWGDGKLVQYSPGQNKIQHTYTETGKYTVQIFMNSVTKLAMPNKRITALDVKRATKLEQLYCYDNDIKTLDVSSNSKLEELLVYGNPNLSNITLGNAPIKRLYVRYNQPVSGQNASTRKNYIDVEGNGRIVYSNGIFMITPDADGFLEDVLVNHYTIGSQHTQYEFLSTDNEVYLKAIFSYSVSYQSFVANAPVVTDGMTPVKYKNNCWIVTTEDDVEWYNYENGRWANVMLSDGLSTTDAVIDGKSVKKVISEGSMFVWIPRYTYKMDYENNTIDIKWSRGKTDYTSGGYYRHPAFFMGEYLGGNPNANSSFSGRTGKINELTGFWVAKYMASEENGVVQSKANKTPVTSYGVNEIFNKLIKMKVSSAYELNQTGIFTHLTKNSEWGAVAYLTMAKGTTPRDNTTEKTSLEKSILQSSTKSIYGVYDLDGPVGEYVAGFKPNALSNATDLNISYYKEHVDKMKKDAERYYGLSLTETDRILAADNNVLPTETQPFFVRGSKEVGLYGYESSNGSATGIGFRPVITIDNTYMTGELSLFETEASVVSGDYLIITVDFSVAKPWKFDLLPGEKLKDKLFDFIDLKFVQTSNAEDEETYTLYQTELNPELLEMTSSTDVIDIDAIDETFKFDENKKYFLKIKVGGYADINQQYPIFINIKNMDSKIIVEQMRLLDEENNELKIEGIPYDKIRLKVHNPNGEVYELESVGLISAPLKTEYDLGDKIDVEGGLLQLNYNGGLSTGTVDLTVAHIDAYDTLTQTPGSKHVELTFKGKRVMQGGEYKSFDINVSNRRKYEVTIDKKLIGVGTDENPGNVTGGGMYYNDDAVRLTAKEYNGYKFKNWESANVTINDSASLVASFVQPTIDVEVTANFLGVISITPEVMPPTEFVKNEPFTLGSMKLVAVYADGSKRYVTADTDGIKTNIDIGEILDVDEPQDVTISYGGENFEYTIDIVKRKYPLYLGVNDINGGVIRDIQDEIKVPYEGRINREEYISYDTVLNYVAEPSPGYEFVGWDCSIEDFLSESDRLSPEISFVMPQSSLTLTANFTLLQYKLQYISTEGGMVLGQTEQILRRGQDGSMVEAFANDGYYFYGWDDGNKEEMRQDTNIQHDAIYTAIFYEGYEVSFFGYDNIQIGETQLVKAGESAIAPDASVVPVKDGYHFTGSWSHDYTEVRSNLNIYALYEKDSYTITTEYNSNAGIVQGEGTYYLDDNVVLSITDIQENYQFVQWTLYKEDDGEWIDVTDILLPGTKEHINITFVMPAYNIKAVANFQSTVLVGIQINGVIVYSHFVVGSEVEIQATETDTRANFNQWLEDSGLFTESQSVMRTIKVTIPETMTIINADYISNTPIYYTFITSAGENGTISPAGTRKVLMGTREEITITPNDGYKVSELYINGYQVNSGQDIPSIIFEYVNGDTIVDVSFEPI